MQTLPGFYARRFTAGVCLLVALAITACSASAGGTSGARPSVAAGTATPLPSPAASSTPQIRLGAQACPEVLKNPDYWDAIIGIQSGVSKVAHVVCANLIGRSTLQAMVLVGYQGAGQIADLYVYNDIARPAPTQLFKLQGLFKGAARISGYNTLLTSEVDLASSLNKGRANASPIPDLFREFKWSDGAGTFVPVTFPAIFPDLTRFQAEAAQQEVNAGHQPWRLSAVQTSQALAANLLTWKSNAPPTLVSGGGSQDLNAVVSVKSTAPGGSTITIVLSRLEGNNNGGIWEATAVDAPGMAISSPQNRDRLNSPTVVSGSGSSFEGVIGRVVILDHLYTDIGHAIARGMSGSNVSFSTPVTYNSSFKAGTQEGVLALYAYSPASGAIAGAVILKELLS